MKTVYTILGQQAGEDISCARVFKVFADEKRQSHRTGLLSTLLSMSTPHVIHNNTFIASSVDLHRPFPLVLTKANGEFRYDRLIDR